MHATTCCYSCNLRRPIKGMIEVIEEGPDFKESSFFCNWKCLNNYAATAAIAEKKCK